MTTIAEPAPKILDDKLLTVLEAADKLNVSRSTLYQIMNRGELRYLRLGTSRTRRIAPADLEKLVTDGLVVAE